MQTASPCSQSCICSARMRLPQGILQRNPLRPVSGHIVEHPPVPHPSESSTDVQPDVAACDSCAQQFHHREPFAPAVNLPADRIPPAEVTACESLIDDHHALHRLRQVIPLGEVATLQQRNSQDLEE